MCQETFLSKTIVELIQYSKTFQKLHEPITSHKNELPQIDIKLLQC